jgi:Uma2 family endonuclease
MIATSPVRTIADLIHRLGDIPADRIRFIPPPGTATKADLLKVEHKNCELVEGTLVEKPVGFIESYLHMYLGRKLGNWVEEHNLGYLTGEAGLYELPGGTVRGPDIAFTSWDSTPDRKLPTDPIPLGSPDLVVEVLSRSNTKREMTRKREEYFNGNVKLVWEIDPQRRKFRVYTSVEDFRDLESGDTIRGEPVLPGFELPLVNVFAELDRHG